MKILVFSLFLVSSCLTNPLPSGENAKCGSPAIKPKTDNIVGGEDAIPYSWPWQVALFVKPIFGEPYQFCGGTIIAPQWILTAGHCFYGETNPSKYQVKLGIFDKTKNESGEQVVGLSEIHVNPQYNPRTITYDITLLKLEHPVNYTKHISPICIPSENETLPNVGDPVYVTGWGATSQGGVDSPTLKQVSVPIVSDDKCNSAYPGQFYEYTQFCAGLDQGGKDSCQGDSGGPVVYQDPKSKIWWQVGITSWGNGCAQPHYYGVYSKVSSYADFIHGLINEF